MFVDTLKESSKVFYNKRLGCIYEVARVGNQKTAGASWRSKQTHKMRKLVKKETKPTHGSDKSQLRLENFSAGGAERTRIILM